MEITTLLEYSDRSQLRDWLEKNHSTEKECWVVMSRSKTPPAGVLPYIDVVEEALCFGWIDSTLKRLPDGRLAQRLSPRRKKSHWTKLNIERCIDLEERGLMTPAGRELYQARQKGKYSDKSACPFRHKHRCEYPGSLLCSRQSRLYCKAANRLERVF